MNKTKFLKKLKEELSSLDIKNIDNIIDEYSKKIDDLIASGMTETKAVKSLGNIDDIIVAIKAQQSTKLTMGDYIDKGINAIANFIKAISKKETKEIVKIVISLCLILILIGFIKIPFIWVEEIGLAIFSILPSMVSTIFNAIWVCILEFCYLVVGIILFVKIIIKCNFTDTQTSDKSTSTQIVSNVTVSIVKILVLILLIFLIVAIVALAFATGISVYLLINGLKYYGTTLLIISLLALSAQIFEIGTNFLAGKSFPAYKTFIKLIIIIFIIGITLTIATYEIASTEVINNSSTDISTKEMVLAIDDDTIIYGYDLIVYDNTLDNAIKVVYEYPTYYTDITIDINYINNNIILNAPDNTYTTQAIENLISTLKNKKVYLYDYQVRKILYISEEDYNTLLNNKAS